MPNELGVASSIAVKHVSGDTNLAPSINGWLKENPDAEVIDIKFAASATDSQWGTDALIIYRKEIY